MNYIIYIITIYYLFIYYLTSITIIVVRDIVMSFSAIHKANLRLCVIM